MSKNITIKDYGVAEYNQILKEWNNPAPVSLKVGYMERGNAMHPDAETSITALAMKHEYGEGVPMRPFVRNFFESVVQKYGTRIQQALDFKNPRRSIFLDLQKLAPVAVSEIGTSMTATPPPLAESTARAKNSSLTLVDTGVMRDAIESKVTDGS